MIGRESSIFEVPLLKGHETNSWLLTSCRAPGTLVTSAGIRSFTPCDHPARGVCELSLFHPQRHSTSQNWSPLAKVLLCLTQVCPTPNMVFALCVSTRSHWLLLEIIQFSEGERNWPSPGRNAALGLQKLDFKYCLKVRRCCHVSAKFDKPWVWEKLGQLGDKEGFYGSTHDSPHRRFLWSFGSLGSPFFCEAISKCYLDSQKGQKCYNKQGVLNTLFGFLTCTNIVSEDNPGTGCLGLLFLGGIR